MIARKPHPDNPDKPERYVLVPLTYDGDRGAWISLLGPEGYYVNHFDAVQECVANFQVLWRNIERVSRRLRAFTEHPSFATFTADGVDAPMITETAQELSSAVEQANDEIYRLLEEPDEDDVIRIGGMLHAIDEISGQLVSSDDDPIEDRTPDVLFLRLIQGALEQVRKDTAKSVSRTGLEDAIDMLILMLPEEGEQEEHDPAQFIADHLFVRQISTASSKIRKRTGQTVSQRALRNGITILEQVLQQRTGALGENSTDTERSINGNDNMQPTNGSELDGDDPLDDDEDSTDQGGSA
ncbi:MAG: hypothetical protein MJE77_19270 [Proteobacteria bacterium]|nr:hypothetical protein [Pseudomonadota bacterium]